jgi:two-component system chemotaxis sensor kinase CheA
MEKIGDPLVHLVRNSLDHGLERPEVRRAAGKSETGLLHLNAFHQGGNIIIEITDDGAGLNEEKIKNKAIERGLISASEELSTDKIHELIFQPGFSTADTITDVSGRGVGMDVVRKNIASLGGSIDVSSTQGKGSTFTIRLPLTLAIMDGQTIRVSDQNYILPLISIIESIEVKNSDIQRVSGKGELYPLRDEYVPVIRLYDVFGLKPTTTDLEEGLLVVVDGAGSKVGLFIDDLLGQQQVVIKSLETNYRKVVGLSGATILGDGTVALILDVQGLVSLYRDPSLAKVHALDERAA